VAASLHVPMAQAHVAVVGVARNCARSIERDLADLRAATRGFASVRFLIVESDSTDGTLACLQRLKAAHDDVDYLALGALRETVPARTARIAHCRNAYLDALRSDPRLAGVTHVMVADLDAVCRALTAEAVASCWRLEVPWAMCSANQGDYYYDVWALRHADWCPDDAWALHERLKPLIGEDEADQLALFARMVHLAPDRAPIEVESSFGGLAIYRRDAILSGRYAGVDDAGRPVCEHVPFHAQLRAAGHRLFIHPGLINAQRTKHAGRKKLFRTWRRKAWNRILSLAGR
jgi:glycosyltransferase involved in cell wall biosynthesis